MASDDAVEALVIAQITLTRYIEPNGTDALVVCTADATGEDLSLIEALGMLSFARESVVRHAMETHD